MALRFTAQSLKEFDRILADVEWFSRVGQPSAWDGGCARIADWSEWPGPENALGEAFAQMTQGLHDVIFAVSPVPAGDLKAVFDEAHEKVLSRARGSVDFDADEDAWDGPTQCVWSAAFDIGLICCVLASGWSVPEDLVELWNWYAAGHWPSTFAAEPDDPPVRRADEVLGAPRRLLVL